MNYISGQVIRLKATFKNDAGQLIDPTGVTVKIGTSKGVKTIYIYGSGNDIIKLSTGVYVYDLELTEGGEWKYLWKSSGIGSAAVQNKFYVDDTIV